MSARRGVNTVSRREPLALVLLLFARMSAPKCIDVNAGTPDELARQLDYVAE